MEGGDKDYLKELYNEFLDVFEKDYKSTENSQQFAVATINKPTTLKPCPLLMNQYSVSFGADRNYVAYTPRKSTDPNRPNGQVHAETDIIREIQPALTGASSVYMVTHFSPCKFCSGLLHKLVNDHEDIKFYIGYKEEYQNKLNDFINALKEDTNVYIGQIASSKSVNRNMFTYAELQVKSCPVVRKHVSKDSIMQLYRQLAAAYMTAG